MDTPEKVMVSDIATAHGGYADIDHTDKDTLRHLSLIDNCNGIIIRPALLGAILRFADELSDDSTRANRYLNATGQIPSENMIFHAYSAALSPIAFNGNTIAFKYYIPFEQAKNRIPNDTGSFLYDEIIKRLSKCMQELEYCSKYSEGFIRISTLSVEIHIMNPVTTHRPMNTLKFSLRLSGYPNAYAIPEDTLTFKTGEALAAHFATQAEVKS